ncbi:hypothetical protein FG386_001939 [Cryptosporidium ryanae]|uniref:uncharacterized protein n=1 Tax=Cryptosporidium ryanae TaxID=515981 RepID=UPI003519E3A8|nr:hypothetical protein FG386_001939 [Cryptosporidium ryanae]
MSGSINDSSKFVKLNQIRNSINSKNVDNQESSNDDFLSYFSNYEKAKIISNYFELSCLEYMQARSSYADLDDDLNNVETQINTKLCNKERPLFLIMSCWKLLWCLTINELIGEVLRYKIETGRVFHIDEKIEIEKYLSIPEITEGEISRYIMAYSPIFRVVLAVLRWLRWESRVNPEKKNDILVKNTYFMDYQESRILNKNISNQKRFYHLDWGISSESKAIHISKNDIDNIEEVFRISYMLLRKGCRMQLDTFLQENARANWIICLIDGMDAYLNSEKDNDYYVDLSYFLDVLPKVDDMWLNENDEENDLILDAENSISNSNGYSISKINNNLALNDTLFKESFEFLDLIERSLIFPSIEYTENEINEYGENEDKNSMFHYSSIVEGNINRIILYHFLKNVVSHNIDSNTGSSNIGNWERTFYSLLCGEFNNLYINSRDDYDKLFALFNTRKINIFNNWADFLENNTQKGRNNIFRGKNYESNSIFNSIYKRVKLMTKDIHDNIKIDYIIDDFDDMQEFVNIDNFQKSYNFDYDCVDNYKYHVGSESHIYYNDNYQNLIKDMNEAEKQFIDSLIDSISYININKSKESLDCLFFNIYIGIINSSLNPLEYNDKLLDTLKDLLEFISSINFNDNQILSHEISYSGSIRAFLAQIVVSHIEIVNSLDSNSINAINSNYKINFFDEYLISCHNNNNISQNSNYLNVPSFGLRVLSTNKSPFLSIPEPLVDSFISQYLNYIIENRKDYASLDMFFLMLEYTSLECRILYIKEIMLKNRNDLIITDFQKVIYNLITQFPSETISVTFDFIDNNVYNILIQNELIKNYANNKVNGILNNFDEIILEIEFIILIIGTIFQFLIIRQEYNPSIDTIFKVVKQINDLNFNNNYNSILSESLSLLENDINNENQCNQTVYEVIIGIFLLNEINNLSQLLFTLEILNIIGNKKDLESIQNVPQLFNLRRTNTCLNEFIIPMILEPVIIRLFTVIASNINTIKPKYTNYKINQMLKFNDFLQAINWENNIVYLISICEYIKVNNLIITLIPIKNVISQINYFNVLSLIKNYKDLIEDFKNNVDNINITGNNFNVTNNYYNQQIFQHDNFEIKSYHSTHNSPKNSLLVSPSSLNNLSSNRHNSQRKNSLQSGNTEKYFDFIEYKLNSKIQDIELVLKNWFVSVPENTITKNYNVDKDEERNKTDDEKLVCRSTISSHKLFFGYCDFSNKFNLNNINNCEHKNRYSLLKYSRFVNIQRLVDQLVFTIIFHHDVNCYYTNRIELINSTRKSLSNNEKGTKHISDTSLIFLHKILKFMDNSDWVLKHINKANSIVI